MELWWNLSCQWSRSYQVCHEEELDILEEWLITPKLVCQSCFVVNEVGEVLPPYCVYKSTAVIMDSWICGGPEGTRYNRSVSGWFDEGLFESWFNDVLLPRMKKQDGSKVMIGDNLSSHISEAVIRKCAKYHIKYRCNPPSESKVNHRLGQY